MDTTMSKRSAANLREKLQKPWLKHVGKLKHLHRETKRIERLIHEQAEKIDPEIWR